MALLPKLELKQGQQLVMTPQLQQAIRLLQLSNVELCTFVETEVERNPLLEQEEGASEPGLAAEEPQRKEDNGSGDDDGDWTPGEASPPADGAAQADSEANGV